jgi:hypothetical protein
MKPSPRLTAAITGKGREVGAEEAHVRSVLAITGKVHRKQARLRALVVEIKRLRRELRHDKRELRAVLQRTPVVTDEQLELAGGADAVDAVNARLEQRERLLAPYEDALEALTFDEEER